MSSRSCRRRRPALIALALPVLFAAGAPAHDGRESGNDLSIVTLSTRPSYVSGGDVLVRIDVPRRVALSDVEVRVNGADVSGAFLPDASGDALIGLVTGLRDGDNLITASTRRSRPSHSARLEVRNSPSSGPVFGGPHQSPWIC